MRDPPTSVFWRPGPLSVLACPFLLFIFLQSEQLELRLLYSVAPRGSPHNG
jgi:hypothetical protein